ncbi:MAG: hypothetical protein Kow0098_28330 [Ignavibacteriaceae bacterium]
MNLLNRLFGLKNSGIDKVPINPFTLSFDSKELNSGFNELNSIRSLRIVRLSLLVAVVIYLSFGLIDQYIVEKPEKLIWIRLLGIAEFFLVIALSYTQSFRKYSQAVLSLLILIGGFNVVVIALQDIRSLYIGLILTSIYAHSLLRIRFIYASLATWVLILIYFYHLFNSGSEYEIILNNIFFLANANLLGMFASYSIEYFMKSEYWKSHLLKEKSLELNKEHDRVMKELEAAREVQLALIPRELPNIPGLTISAHMKSASEIGGDFYDFKLLPDSELVLAIGDATGHGAKAGAMVTAVKILFSEYAASCPIDEFMVKINSALRKIRLPSLYMSFAIARIKDNVIEITGAGMPPMIILRNNNPIHLIELKGIPLGVVAETDYRKTSFELKAGDKIILMTDGLTESFNKKSEMLGFEKVVKLLKSCRNKTPGDIIASLLDLRSGWSEGEDYSDDLTLIAISVDELINDNKFAANLPENNNAERQSD